MGEIFRQIRKPLFYFGIVFLIALILGLTTSLASVLPALASKNKIINNENTGLVLLDDTGKPFYTFDHKNISYVSLATIPKTMQQAVIAAEDKNFYSNPGFSISGILRAALIDVFNRRVVEGGSTITQQLVKNALLSPQQSFLRKSEEIILAYLITQKYSKSDILEMYLNSVYFGEGSFGIQTAAQTYFGENANNLDLAQAALLTGLIPAPSAYSPLSNDPQIAKTHQKEVLQEMVSQGFISQDQATQAEAEPLAYTTIKPADQQVIAPQFAIMVKDALFKKYGEENVIRSGLMVKTTLDRTWQAYAQQEVQNQVAHLAPDNVSNGAAVVIDPTNGEIKVMVGSHNWFDPVNGQMNMALSPRQPGSSFKPIIYAAALSERLITPASILEDVPTTFPGNYKPHDYDYKYRGPVTVRRALANSLNIPAVEVMQMVGVNQGVSEAENFGITTLTSPSDYGLSFVLGAANVPLLEMTNFYAMLANQGVYNTPTAILKVTDKNGTVLDSYAPNPQSLLDPGVAFLLTSILSDNRARAEEFGNLLTINRPAAVKTGTSNDFRDSLTLGYTPSLAVGVWVGNNNNAPMDNIAGSLGAAPIWKALMEEFLAGTPIQTFSPPSDIVQASVCPYAGTKSQLASSSAYMEYFLSGTQPQDNLCNRFPSPEPSVTLSIPTSTIPTIPPTDTPIPTPTAVPTPTPGVTNNPAFAPLHGRVPQL